MNSTHNKQNCPKCSKLMEHETARLIITYSGPLKNEHHYRCDDCDASYVLDWRTKKLRLADSRD